MENKDYIKELFSDKLSNLEAPVRPELWSGVASQIAAVAPAASVSISLVSKFVIGVSVAASIALGTYLIFDKTAVTKKARELKQQVSIESVIQETLPLSDDSKIVTSKKEQKESLKKLEETTEPLIIEQKQNKLIDTSLYLPIQQKREEKKDIFVIPIPQDNKVVPIVVEHSQDQTVEKEEFINIVEKKEMYLPNIITPNGDGVHDNLLLDLSGFSDISVVVLNMKNEIVFQTTDPSFIWDGDLLSGDFIYYLTCRDSKGKLVSKYNSLRIQR